jgi:hypothetical protein
MYSMSPKTGKLLNDKEVVEKYVKENEWGLSTAIDLRKCDPEKVRSKQVITQFAIDLCDYINMKRFGEPVVVPHPRWRDTHWPS